MLGADYEDNGRSYDRASLAEILMARGNLDEAREIAAEALAEAARRHPQAHPDVAFALVIDAELLAAGGDPARASALADRAVAMHVTLEDQGSEKAIRARLLLGEILHKLGQDGAARPQLQSALAATGAMTPAAPALAAHIEGDLARVAAALGDVATAARMRERAQAALAEVEEGQNAERGVVLRLVEQEQS